MTQQTLKIILAALLLAAPRLALADDTPPPPPSPPVISFDDFADEDFSVPSEEKNVPLTQDEENLLEGLEEEDGLEPWEKGQGADAPPPPQLLEDAASPLDPRDELEPFEDEELEPPPPAPLEFEPEENPAVPPAQIEKEEDPFAVDVFEEDRKALIPKAAKVEPAAPVMAIAADDDPFGGSPFGDEPQKDAPVLDSGAGSFDQAAGGPPTSADAPPPPALNIPAEEEPSSVLAEEDKVGDEFMSMDFEEREPPPPAKAEAELPEDPFAGMPDALPAEAAAAIPEESAAPHAIDAAPQTLKAAGLNIDSSQLAEKAWFSDDIKINIDVVGKDNVLAGSILLARAQDLERRHRYYEAWRLYYDVAKKYPRSRIAKGALHGFYGRRLLVRAYGLEKQKRYFEAAHTYRDAIKRNRQDARAWYGLGKIYYRYRKQTEAAACFEKVIELKPQGNEALAKWLKAYRKNSKSK